MSDLIYEIRDEYDDIEGGTIADAIDDLIEDPNAMKKDTKSFLITLAGGLWTFFWCMILFKCVTRVRKDKEIHEQNIKKRNEKENLYKNIKGINKKRSLRKDALLNIDKDEEDQSSDDSWDNLYG